LTIQPNFQIGQANVAAKKEKASGCGCSHKKEQAAPAPQESVSISTTPSPVKEEKAAQPQAPAQPAPTPTPEKTVKVAVYTQDPYVNRPLTMETPQELFKPDLSSSRVRIEDNRAHAKPDADGNFVFADGTDGVSQANTLYYTQATLQAFEGYRGSKIGWATRREQLTVNPHEQQGRNAYYSRGGGGTAYFYDNSPSLNTVVKTANATDVVSHETGHALLDGLRPGFFSTHDLETGAFHEAFGDCAAMLMCLKDPSNRAKLLEQTGGDLRKHNVLSSLAEEFGAAIHRDNKDPNDDNREYLRTTLNSFKYTDPKNLPPGRGDHDNMGAQVHSFSRLFSASFYDCLESIFKQSVAEGQSADQALQTAEKVAGPLLVRAIESGSASQARYKALALSMIAGDQANGGKYAEGFKQVFLNREIISPADIKAEEERKAQLPAVQLPGEISNANSLNFLEANMETLGLPADKLYIPENVTTNGQGETFVSFRYAQEVPVTVAGLEDKVTDVQGGVNLVFDASGKLVDRVHTEITAETVENEMAGIAHLQANNAIIDKEALNIFKSSGDTSIFKSVIEGNKIVRVPISGCDHEGHSH
jgi:hypothetical protein